MSPGRRPLPHGFTHERPANFATAPGFKGTTAGAAEVAKIKAYAKRHSLTFAQAATRYDDPQLIERDELRTFAQEKGITVAEAAILKGYR